MNVKYLLQIAELIDDNNQFSDNVCKFLVSHFLSKWPPLQKKSYKTKIYDFMYDAILLSQ